MKTMEAIVKAAQAYIEDRVAIEPNCGCWLWLPSLGSHGYGNASFQALIPSRATVAHRLSYVAFKGDIPEGYEVDHLCRVKSCVNPEHLQAVPHFVNSWRAWGEYPERLATRESGCPRGHGPYSAGKRHYCKQCNRDRNAAYRARQKITANTRFEHGERA
jgi:HNH endonuclease